MRGYMNIRKRSIEFMVKGVKIIGIFFLAWLTYSQTVRTFSLPLGDYSMEFIWEYVDSPWRNLLFGICFVVILFVLQKIILRGDPEKQRKKVCILAVIDIILVGLLLTFWVTISQIKPYWDQLQLIWTTEKFLTGDYSDMNLLYYGMFTQQYGLIWFEEFFLGIWNDYRILQYINVLFIMAIIFFFYRITDLLFSNQRVNLYCLIGITLFLPMHIYVVYVYGDLGSIALCLIAIWGLLKWNATGKLRYLPIALLSASVATLIRYSSFIILLAILIVFLINACKTWNWRPLIIGVAVLVLPVLSIQLVQGYYELRSGIEIGKGLPVTVWLSMGLQGDFGSIGLDSGYDEWIWGYYDGDRVAVSKHAIADIIARLREMKANPVYAKEFFRFKALEQWIEPTFSSLTLTGKFDQPAHPLVEYIYIGSIPDLIYRVMDRYLFVLYFCALVHAIKSLFQEDNIYSLLMLILFIGGFVFSLIWEAKGRYVMPYVMFLIPYMACGISYIHDLGSRFLYKLLKKDLC